MMDYPKYYAELPNKIMALRGSCVQIPCTFNTPDNMLKNAESIFGCWIKKNHAFLQPDSLVVFNGSTNIIKGFSHIEILGNLSQSGCTTVFYDVMNNHTDNYYFRVEMKTAIIFHLVIFYTMFSCLVDVPKLPILTPTDLKEVMEETRVNLSCSAEAPCPKQPPTISWSNIPESAHITTQLQEKPDKTQSVFSYMTFKASYKDHRKNITCTATYPRNTSNDSTVESTITLKVLFSPKETHITIDPSDSVSAGTNVTLTCKSKASPNEMNYTWYKLGQEKELDFGEQLTFNVNRNCGGWYFCTAKNKYGNQTSKEIQLIVAGEYQYSTIHFTVMVYYVQKPKTMDPQKCHVLFLFLFQGQEKHMEISSIYENSAFATTEELEMPKDETEIHYGQIDFSNSLTKSVTVKCSGQETIYAEVCGSGKD
uniref:Ig-like domain-containing protein n=1 Tax=Cyprinus carpio TaxID=7962 RepID=A0A8C1ZQH1_CYPCA